MESFLENCRSIDPNQMQKDFPAAYRALLQTCFDAAEVLILKSGIERDISDHRSIFLITMMETVIH